jgi:hypothetical protein
MVKAKQPSGKTGVSLGAVQSTLDSGHFP